MEKIFAKFGFFTICILCLWFHFGLTYQLLKGLQAHALYFSAVHLAVLIALLSSIYFFNFYKK